MIKIMYFVLDDLTLQIMGFVRVADPTEIHYTIFFVILQ